MTLAERQRALVDALVAGGEVPPGFAAAGVRAAAVALRRKRAGEVARTWPFLAASFGDRWYPVFTGWAVGRPTQGSLRDGWDFARSTSTAGLSPLAREELAEREAALRYDGVTAPVPRGRLASRVRLLLSRHGSRAA